jgi:hypothetical protein
VKLALLKGNRFNPWHLTAFQHLPDDPEVVAFRAESEIQNYFKERSDAPLDFKTDPIYFDTQAGPLPTRLLNTLPTRYAQRARQHALNRFPLEKYTHALADLFNGLHDA